MRANHVIGRLVTPSRRVRRDHGSLIANALMHLVNDGCFVALTPILPLVAAEFDLTYTQVGLLKTALTTSSSAFQIPLALAAERFGEIALLALGTAWVAGGFLALGLVTAFLPMLFLLFGAGIGGSVQHPVASSFISREYDGRRRGSALGVLNFAGDIGKLLVPLVFALTLGVYGWRNSLGGLAVVALLFSLVFWLMLRQKDRGRRATQQRSSTPTARGWGILHPRTFVAVLSMGVLDASVRSALLTFVPFLLLNKGMTEAHASLMLTIVFAGGALGKLGCGILADRLGLVLMIVLTEILTGAFILLLIPAGLWAMLPLLFCVGFCLNGTSSVLLDGVAELFDPAKRSRGYGLYFTIYLGASAIGPIVYGIVGDVWSLTAVFWAMALASLAIVPLTGLYRRSRAA